MLCSKCKKKQATIFINEPTKDDPEHLVGYCNDCAKEKGILADTNSNTSKSANNINNIGAANLDQIASQFGVIFKDLTNNINPEDIEELEENGGIPIGSIFGMFGNTRYSK